MPFTETALESNPGHNIGLVIDRSSSLKAQSDSLAPTYWQLENLFAEQLAKDKSLKDYSVTLFAGKPNFPKQSKLPNILKQSPSEDNDGSAIYDAILASALRDGALTTERSPYSILLLTDGSDNKSRLSEKTLINILLQHHIRVDVIAFGSRNDSVYYFMGDSIGGGMIKNRQDFSDVERIAKATDGLFILIEDNKQFSSAIRKVQEGIYGRTPTRRPEENFSPEQSLLLMLYEEIENDSMKDF